jgi:hypothetical protein
VAGASTAGAAYLVVDTDARVEVDLCTGDRWRMDAWVGAAQYLLIDGDTPLDVRAAGEATRAPRRGSVTKAPRRPETADGGEEEPGKPLGRETHCDTF